jgi:hypothetical protein
LALRVVQAVYALAVIGVANRPAPAVHPATQVYGALVLTDAREHLLVVSDDLLAALARIARAACKNPYACA